MDDIEEYNPSVLDVDSSSSQSVVQPGIPPYILERLKDERGGDLRESSSGSEAHAAQT